jgi:hypothetical protein
MKSFGGLKLVNWEGFQTGSHSRFFSPAPSHSVSGVMAFGSVDDEPSA